MSQKRIKIEDVRGRKFTPAGALKHDYLKWLGLALMEWYRGYLEDLFGLLGENTCATCSMNDDCTRCPIYKPPRCCAGWYRKATDARSSGKYKPFILAAQNIANHIAGVRNRLYPKLKPLPLITVAELPLKSEVTK